MSCKNFNVFRKFVNSNAGKLYSSKEISQKTGLGVGEVAHYIRRARLPKEYDEEWRYNKRQKVVIYLLEEIK